MLAIPGLAAGAFSIWFVRAADVRSKKPKRGEVQRLGPIKRELLSSMVHGQSDPVPQYRLWPSQTATSIMARPYSALLRIIVWSGKCLGGLAATNRRFPIGDAR